MWLVVVVLLLIVIIALISTITTRIVQLLDSSPLHSALDGTEM